MLALVIRHFLDHCYVISAQVYGPSLSSLSVYQTSTLKKAELPCRSETTGQSQVKELLDLLQGIRWILDSVTGGPRIAVDLPVVTSHKSFVAKEMYGLVPDSGEILGWVIFGLYVL